MALTCRFYEQKFPEIEDVVMVNVRSIADMGAYVHLLEYNNIEGKSIINFSVIVGIYVSTSVQLGQTHNYITYI